MKPGRLISVIEIDWRGLGGQPHATHWSPRAA